LGTQYDRIAFFINNDDVVTHFGSSFNAETASYAMRFNNIIGSQPLCYRASHIRMRLLQIEKFRKGSMSFPLIIYPEKTSLEEICPAMVRHRSR